MTEEQLKEEWVALSIEVGKLSTKYFMGQVLELIDIEETNVVLIQGYLDNSVVKSHFPLLKDILNTGFYTPVKLILNGGKLEILEEKQTVQTMKNLDHDFSENSTAYVLSENLDEKTITLEYLKANTEESKNHIEFWNNAVKKPFDDLNKNEIKNKIEAHNLPRTFEYKPKGIIVGILLFAVLGFSILFLYFKEGMADSTSLWMSILMLTLSGLSLFLYLNTTKVTLTKEGINIKPLLNPRTVLWSDISSIDKFTNSLLPKSLITYQPTKSSDQKNVWGGYVIPLDNRNIEENLLILKELHYYYTEVAPI
jgi:uncharacterized protein YlaN (UPF0358 family)